MSLIQRVCARFGLPAISLIARAASEQLRRMGWSCPSWWSSRSLKIVLPRSTSLRILHHLRCYFPVPLFPTPSRCLIQNSGLLHFTDPSHCHHTLAPSSSAGKLGSFQRAAAWSDHCHEPEAVRDCLGRSWSFAAGFRGKSFHAGLSIFAVLYSTCLKLCPLCVMLHS